MKKSLEMLGIIGLSSLILAGCGHQSQENHSFQKFCFQYERFEQSNGAELIIRDIEQCQSSS